MEKKNNIFYCTAEEIDKIVMHNDYEVGDSFCAGDAIRPLVAPNCSEYVVAHAKFDLRQVRYFSEVSLLPHILITMQKLGLRRLQRLQSYSWPHMSAGNGHGMMIVSAPRSGRTLSYIPPLCDLVCRALTAGRRLRGTAQWYPDQEGAMAVILVPDAERVRQVSALCHALLRKAADEEWFTLTMTYVASKKVELIQRLLNGVACMVVTPAQLVGLHEDAPGVLRFPRLQFVVFDDIDLMPPDQVQKADQVLQELLPRDRHPQMVLVSQSYNHRLMAKLMAANSHPALIFGDILEAAVYGGTHIRIALSNPENKVNEVFRALQQRPPKDFRTVIFCSDDLEMRRLVEALEKRCHACLPFYQNADLEVRQQVHHWMAKSRGIILLCTDNCPELTIRHAHTLIHYGMSSTWSKFKMRHLAISGNLNNRLSPAKRKSEAVSLHSLVLLDYENQKQLPRLVDFLKQHQKVDANVDELVTKVRQDMEKESGNLNAICRQIMVKGSCFDPVCNERHHVTDLDRCHASVPTKGDVKVKLVRVYSPTHYCVYLVEHLTPEGTWQPLPNLAAQHMRIQLLQEAKPRRYWPPVPGAICMYHSAFNERVRVLQVPSIKNVNLVQISLPVVVQAIDMDTRIFTTNSGKLYKCSAELQQLPPMAIDLRLLGLVPLSEERDWMEEDRRSLEHKFELLPKEHFLQAHIQFATANTLFVRNLVAMTYASSLKMHVRSLSLSHVLIADKLVKRCDEAEDKTLDFFKAGRKVEYAKRKIKEEELKVVKEQVEVELQLKLEEEQKENVSPPEKVKRQAPGSNHLEKKQEQLKVMSSPITQELSEPPFKPDSIAQLYDCLMRCSLLELEEKQQSEKNSIPSLTSSVAFLENVMKGEALKTPSKPKKHKKPRAIKATPEPPHKNLCQKILIQLPPHVVRPTISYYQTQTTLELQVLLPEEIHEYAALLEKGQVFFWAICKSLELKHQFVLNLSISYIFLSHRMRGRTVYISVQKALADVDLLHFGAYPFMKPNHEMFAKFDEQQKNQVKRIKDYLKELVCVEQKVQSQDDEDSYDEDQNSDGVELPAHNKIYEDY
ncbi:hypothetical protein KR054_004816 [Drosophila jambulina]|nr:hypothetical protein KR054_004816 [Drosophila jambulina]